MVKACAKSVLTLGAKGTMFQQQEHLSKGKKNWMGTDIILDKISLTENAFWKRLIKLKWP